MNEIKINENIHEKAIKHINTLQKVIDSKTVLRQPFHIVNKNLINCYNKILTIDNFMTLEKEKEFNNFIIEEFQHINKLKEKISNKDYEYFISLLIIANEKNVFSTKDIFVYLLNNNCYFMKSINKYTLIKNMIDRYENIKDDDYFIKFYEEIQLNNKNKIKLLTDKKNIFNYLIECTLYKKELNNVVKKIYEKHKNLILNSSAIYYYKENKCNFIIENYNNQYNYLNLKRKEIHEIQSDLLSNLNFLEENYNEYYKKMIKSTSKEMILNSLVLLINKYNIPLEEYLDDLFVFLKKINQSKLNQQIFDKMIDIYIKKQGVTTFKSQELKNDFINKIMTLNNYSEKNNIKTNILNLLKNNEKHIYKEEMSILAENIEIKQNVKNVKKTIRINKI